MTTISDTINVTIVPVNDAPIMVDLQPQTMLEDDTLKLELEGTDVDGDDIYFVTESVEEVNASISIEGDSLIIIPELDWNGLVDVPVHLFDGSGANDVSILELTVQPIDDPTVVVQNIPDAAFIENFEHEWTADLNSVFMDVDNELDFIAVVEDTTVIGFNIENDILQLFSEEALNGITDMIVSAYNPEFPEVITAMDTFQISVANANNYPVIEPILDITMNEDDTLRIPLLGSDVDGDDVYFVVGFVDHVSTDLVDSGDTLILIPEPDWFGEALVTVNIFDGMGASDATSFLLTVRDVDDLPVVRDYIEDITLYEDFTQPWIRDLNEVFLDIDGELTFEAVFDDPSLLNMDLMNGI